MRGEAGERSEFFCGAYVFEGDICTRLLDLLPEVVRLRPAAGSALRATLDLLAREMLDDEPGQQTLLDRLLDVALVQVLREHFAAQGAEAPAWFRASRDPELGPVLRAVHEDPARRWTVEELADQASLSRAAFARRFTAQMGVAPLAYLNGWRMALARERLRDSTIGSPPSPTPSATRRSSPSPRPSSATTASPPAAGAPPPREPKGPA